MNNPIEESSADRQIPKRVPPSLAVLPDRSDQPPDRKAKKGSKSLAKARSSKTRSSKVRSSPPDSKPFSSSDVAQMIAHEIRDPLTLLLGYTNQLRRCSVDETPDMRQMRILSEASSIQAQAMDMVVHGWLELSDPATRNDIPSQPYNVRQAVLAVQRLVMGIDHVMLDLDSTLFHQKKSRTARQKKTGTARQKKTGTAHQSTKRDESLDSVLSGHDLDLDTPPVDPVSWDLSALSQATVLKGHTRALTLLLWNLIGEARRYGRWIEVSGNDESLCVANLVAMKSENSGQGLGLGLAKKLAQAAGVEISAKTSLMKGLSDRQPVVRHITISWKLEREQQAKLA